jgi:hypothetical protein
MKYCKHVIIIIMCKKGFKCKCQNVKFVKKFHANGQNSKLSSNSLRKMALAIN